MSEFAEARSRLRAANPVGTEDVPSADSPQAEALFEKIVATDLRGASRRTGIRWRRTWLLVPAALLAAAAGYGVFHETSKPFVVACFAEPSLTASRTVVSSVPAGPTAACGELWRPGGEFSSAGDAGLPPLFACVLDTGTVGVFPGTKGSDPCSALGLAHAGPPGKTHGKTDPIVEVQTALSDAFIGRCVGRDEAISLAKEQLAGQGLLDWHVAATTPFTQQAPCASLAIDIPTRTILLVPVSDSS
jgi:hypothetical protein